MIKARWHEPLTAQERAAEIARVREMLDLAVDLEVRVGGSCPTCGRPVTDLSVEPLEYERRGGALTPTSVVAVALPCGHSFLR